MYAAAVKTNSSVKNFVAMVNKGSIPFSPYLSCAGRGSLMQRKNVAIVNPLLAMDRDARTLAVSDRFAAGLRTVVRTSGNGFPRMRSFG
jgi:hypothetical protein